MSIYGECHTRRPRGAAPKGMMWGTKQGHWIADPNSDYMHTNKYLNKQRQKELVEKQKRTFEEQVRKQQEKKEAAEIQRRNAEEEEARRIQKIENDQQRK